MTTLKSELDGSTLRRWSGIKSGSSATEPPSMTRRGPDRERYPIGRQRGTRHRTTSSTPSSCSVELLQVPYTHVASPCLCSMFRPAHYSVTRLLRRAVGVRTPHDLHKNICAVRAISCTLATHGKGGSLEYTLGARYLGWLWCLGGVRRKDLVVQIASAFRNLGNLALHYKV